MGFSLVMRVIFLGLVFLAFGISSSAQAEVTDRDAILNLIRIEGRLLYHPLDPADPDRVAALQIVRAGNGSAESYQAAARYYTEKRPEFVRGYLRDFFATYLNLSRTHVSVKFNKATALMIAMATQGNKNYKRMFTANLTCVVQMPDGSLVDPQNVSENDLAVLDLRTAIVCNPGQSAVTAADQDVRAPLPDSEVAGFVTLDGEDTFSKNMLSGGTTLREILGLLNMLGPGHDLFALRRPDYQDDFVGPFVTRFPAGGGLPTYRSFCVGCHEVMGSAVQCFNWPNYRDNRGMVYDPNPNVNNSRCNGSSQDQKNNYPAGYVKSDGSWTTPFLSGDARALEGDRNTRTQGVGKASLLEYWTNLRQLDVEAVRQIFEGSVGVCPGVSYAGKIDAYADDLIKDGNIGRVISNVAADPDCLGL